ncbi:MAG: sugar phosphorylase [Candidatus Moranbacteria bacterium]|nr:sugar phosphorylase [Candidatus Moranbacteria bacterium]
MDNKIKKFQKEKIRTSIRKIYPNIKGKELSTLNKKIYRILENHLNKNKIDLKSNLQYNSYSRLTEKTIILITYGDFIRSKSKKNPLEALHKFSKDYLKSSFDTIHILPFYPYSSDRGFSVINYKQVDKKIGTWDQISKIGNQFNLMFDLVLNHISCKSQWFIGFINGDKKFENFFLAYPKKNPLKKSDLAKILRPRVSELFSKFSTTKGDQYVWTTFSADQIDLNYQNPKVLIEMMKVLLFYCKQSVDFLRFDATTYIWKTMGTNCAHRPEAHAIVSFFRIVLDMVKPNVTIVNETNVPHLDNISYFGNGYDEAQMVYNFPLPPLTLHTFLTGNCSKLSNWAKTLNTPSDLTTYFNFLDSHDGIGVLPAKNILTSSEINNLVKTTLKRGGLVNYRTGINNKKTPYELNITWYSFLNSKSLEKKSTRIKRYIASRAVALSLKGVPGIYFHGLFGSKNNKKKALKTKINRDINRTNLKEEELLDLINNKKSVHSLIFSKLLKLLKLRNKYKAFHPSGKQIILMNNNSIFSILRQSRDQKDKVLILINVSNKNQLFKFYRYEAYFKNFNQAIDIITGKTFELNKDVVKINLTPYTVYWLKLVE